MRQSVPSSADPRQIINDLRVKRGFTSTRALATAAGISQPTLSRYMNGTSDVMEVANFWALARVLDVTLSELLGEVPLSNGGRVAEMARIMRTLPESSQRAIIAAAKAMAAEDKPGSK